MGSSVTEVVCGATEIVEGFVDDSGVVATTDLDFITINKIIIAFEQVSGAILNRDRKSKVLGLGAWKDRAVWPLPWLFSVPHIKIFGFIIHPCLKTLIDIGFSLWEGGGFEDFCSL